MAPDMIKLVHAAPTETISRQEIYNVSLVSTNKSTTILYTTTSVVQWLVFLSGVWLKVYSNENGVEAKSIRLVFGAPL
jgi:hypothetical protein